MKEKGKIKVKDAYPELVKYFKNKKDAETYSIRSDKKILVKCPNCGHEHIMIVKNLTRRHYRCPVCGDGNYFPEKLLLAIFDSLSITYIYQANNKVFNWCKKYRYDFYLPKENAIIEVDGAQHTNSEFKFNGSISLEEQKKIDDDKENLAIENGISSVIRIDFSDRDLQVVKQNISDSLKSIINVNKIDWENCVSLACGSNILEFCKKWENEKDKKNTKEIAKEIGISRDKLVRYLHKGTIAGFCVYDGKREKHRAAKKGGQTIKEKRTRKVEVFSEDNKSLGFFESAKKLVEVSKEIFGVQFTYSGIVYVCNGTNKTHMGYKFKYKYD